MFYFNAYKSVKFKYKQYKYLINYYIVIVN